MSPLPIAARAARARCCPDWRPCCGKKHGVDEMHLLTGMTNLAAQAAYRKAGFQPHAEQYMTRALR